MLRIGRNLQPLNDPPAVLVTLDGDAPDVDPSRRQILMSQRVLRLDDAARLFGDYPREGVARLVDVHLPQPRLARVPLQVLVEGVGGERRARLPRPVVPRPQRTLAA